KQIRAAQRAQSRIHLRRIEAGFLARAHQRQLRPLEHRLNQRQPHPSRASGNGDFHILTPHLLRGLVYYFWDNCTIRTGLRHAAVLCYSFKSSQKSLTRAKKWSDWGLMPLPDFSNSLSSSRCFLSSFTGVSTCVWIYMSPREAERRMLMPLPRSRIWW